MQVEAFESSKAALQREMRSAVDSIAHYSKLLYQCRSCAAVDIRVREVNHRQAQVGSMVEDKCKTCVEGAAAAWGQLTDGIARRVG